MLWIFVVSAQCTRSKIIIDECNWKCTWIQSLVTLNLLVYSWTSSSSSSTYKPSLCTVFFSSTCYLVIYVMERDIDVVRFQKRNRGERKVWKRKWWRSYDDGQCSSIIINIIGKKSSSWSISIKNYNSDSMVDVVFLDPSMCTHTHTKTIIHITCVD